MTELTRMEAKIVTGDGNAEAIISKLTALGFELEVIDWFDDDATTIVAVKLTEVNGQDYFLYVDGIVAPLGGTLMHVDIVPGPELVQAPGTVRRRMGYV
jgi:hypothetical protein